MGCRLTGCLGTVMARCAICGYSGMHKRRGGPCCRFVAIFAYIARRQMGCRLSGRLGTIMTCRAGRRDPGMFKSRWGPGGRLVAIFADVAGCQMGCRLAGRLRAIMARCTICSNALMVKTSSAPSVCRFVTIFASIT
jgi:hypothetical protein